MDQVSHQEQTPNVVSIQRASELLQVSRTQIYRLMEDHFLIEVVIADKRMVDFSSLLHYKNIRSQINDLKLQLKQQSVYSS